MTSEQFNKYAPLLISLASQANGLGDYRKLSEIAADFERVAPHYLVALLHPKDRKSPSQFSRFNARIKREIAHNLDAA